MIDRSVYEGPEPEKFLDHLDARIKSHNKEIERMCNHHYQGFIESVHSLLQVRSDVEKLKVLLAACMEWIKCLNLCHKLIHSDCSSKIHWSIFMLSPLFIVIKSSLHAECKDLACCC